MRRWFKRINPIDAAFGLMVLFLLVHILGFALSMSLAWWTEPDISSISPSQVFPGETIRIRGRNFDPRAKIKMGDRVLDIDVFLTSYAIELQIPKGFIPGRYPVSITNRWNRQGNWDGQLEVKDRRPSIRRPILVVPSAPAPATPNSPTAAVPVSPTPAEPKPLIPIETRLDVWLEPPWKNRSSPRISILCFLRIENISLEHSYKKLIKTLPKDIQILTLVPEREGFLAQVTLYSREHPESDIVTYSLYGHELLKKGLSFYLIDDRNYRISGVAIEDPVPVGAKR